MSVDCLRPPHGPVLQIKHPPVDEGLNHKLLVYNCEPHGLYLRNLSLWNLQGKHIPIWVNGTAPNFRYHG